MKKTIITISSVALAGIIYATQIKNYALNPNVTQENITQTICKSGWTATIRPSNSYTTKLKIEQLKSQEFTDKNTKDYEEDHRLSLELGGAPSDPKNLYPQPYSDSVQGINIGAREKDTVETYLNHQVCSGKMDLKTAQQSLINDWAKIYLTLKGYQIEPSTTDE